MTLALLRMDEKRFESRAIGGNRKAVSGREESDHEQTTTQKTFFHSTGHLDCPSSIVSVMNQKPIVLYFHLKGMSAPAIYDDLGAAPGDKALA
jgi:hypothetical protein